MNVLSAFPDEWLIEEFRDADLQIIDGDRGRNYPARSDFQRAGHCLFLNTGNIKNDSFNFSDGDFITLQKSASLRKGKLERNDIVLTTRGTIGSLAHFNHRVPFENIRINSGMVIIRVGDTLSAGFLYQLLKSTVLKSQFLLYSSGSAQPQLPIKDLRRIKLLLPQLSTQIKIEAFLSAYDDLIENNRRRIDLLERMAEQIYREWFVRFRFPGYQQAKFDKGFPVGWLQGRVVDLIDRRPFGRVYREHELLDEGDVAVLDQSQNDHLGFHSGAPQHQASEDDPLLLFGDHTCKMLLMTGPFSLAENVIPFRPKGEVLPHFLYQLIRGLTKTSEYKRHWTELCTKQVIWPPSVLQRKFEVHAAALHEQKLLLQKSCIRAGVARDLLLPRLISGKLRVEELDIQFPPSMQTERA